MLSTYIRPLTNSRTSTVRLFPLGEAYSALLRMALSLKETGKEPGIILCVSSKNDEAIALEAYADIVAFRVNWDHKAANIKAIADAIDLGLDAFVFLDDTPTAKNGIVRDHFRRLGSVQSDS